MENELISSRIEPYYHIGVENAFLRINSALRDSDSQQLLLPAFIQNMAHSIDEAGHTSTRGWDVVYSIHSIKLNSLLQNKYEAGKLAKYISFTQPYTDPISGNNYSFNFHFNLASPVISFTGQQAKVDMPIIAPSNYTITPVQGGESTTKPIPLKHNITAIIPLGSINGNTGVVTPKADVVTFSDGNDNKNHIILHFKNQGATYDIVPPDVIIESGLPSIRDYFRNVSEIDYALTEVNNQAGSSGFQVTPQSFIFHTYGSGNNSVLSIYIQTNLGNQPGDTELIFSPNGKDMLPIPTGYETSLILSYNAFKNYLIQQLKGFTLFDFEPDLKSGFTVKAYNGGSLYTVLGKDENKHGFGYMSESFIQKKNDTINQNNPFLLDFSENMLNITRSSAQIVAWHDMIMNGYQVVNCFATYGHVAVETNLKESMKFSVNSSGIDGLILQLKQSDFNLNLLSAGCNGYHSKLCFGIGSATCSNDISVLKNQIVYNLTLTVIQFEAINFLATTNILLPTMELNFDSAAGVNIPLDMVLVGTMVDQSANH